MGGGAVGGGGAADFCDKACSCNLQNSNSSTQAIIIVQPLLLKLPIALIIICTLLLLY